MTRPVFILPAALVLLSSSGCYKPYVSPEAIIAVTEIDEKNVPPELELVGSVEVSVPGDPRYPNLGITNGRGAVREATYKKGATHFAIVLVKQGLMSTDVVAKIYKRKS